MLLIHIRNICRFCLALADLRDLKTLRIALSIPFDQKMRQRIIAAMEKKQKHNFEIDLQTGRILQEKSIPVFFCKKNFFSESIFFVIIELQREGDFI